MSFRPDLLKRIETAALLASAALFATAVAYEAETVAIVVLGFCLVSYGIVYAPWDRPEPHFRNTRNRIASVLFAAMAWFFMWLGVSWAVMFPHDWHLPAGLALLALPAYRSSCEVAYAVSDRFSITRWFV